MTTDTARHVLKTLEHDLRPADFDALSRDELHRFNRALYRWHSEARARLHGKPPLTTATLTSRPTRMQPETTHASA